MTLSNDAAPPLSAQSLLPPEPLIGYIVPVISSQIYKYHSPVAVTRCNSNCITLMLVCVCRCTSADIGWCVGAVCFPPTVTLQQLQAAPLTSPHIIGVHTRTVTGIDTSVLSVGVQLIPHSHHKYCARRERVCTAIGRYRQGEVLQAVIRGPQDLARDYKIVWQRSKQPVMTYAEGLDLGNDGDLLLETDEFGTTVIGGDGSAIVPDKPLPLSSAHRRQSLLAYQGTIDASELEYEAYTPRPLSHLPPSPPDYARAPTLDEVMR